MPTKLADTRTLTLEDAKQTFADLARAEIAIAKETAAAEARIARLKAQHQDAIAALVAARDAHRAELSAFIMAHPEQFTKPRAVTTDYGKFGRRTVSNVDVADDELLIQWALDNAHLDCIRVTRAPVKPAIAERLRAGQAVPGCSLVTGEEAFYTVAKALLEDAAAESAA